MVNIDASPSASMSSIGIGESWDPSPLREGPGVEVDRGAVPIVEGGGVGDDFLKAVLDEGRWEYWAASLERRGPLLFVPPELARTGPEGGCGAGDSDAESLPD